MFIAYIDGATAYPRKYGYDAHPFFAALTRTSQITVRKMVIDGDNRDYEIIRTLIAQRMAGCHQTPKEALMYNRFEISDDYREGDIS